MVGVVDAHSLADGAYFFVCIEKEFLCFVDPDLIQILQRGILIIARKLPDQREFIHMVLNGKVIQGILFLIRRIKTFFDFCKIGRDMVGTGLTYGI